MRQRERLFPMIADGEETMTEGMQEPESNQQKQNRVSRGNEQLDEDAMESAVTWY